MKDKELELINEKRIFLKQKIDKIAETVEVATVLLVALLVELVALLGGSILSGEPASSDHPIIIVSAVVGLVVGGISGAVAGLAVSKIMELFFGFLIGIFEYVDNHKMKVAKVTIPKRYKLLSISGFLFSSKTQKEVFEVIMADWDDETYTALEKNKDSSLFMINSRNTYAFLAAIWMKSPIGHLIEFIQKFAK